MGASLCIWTQVLIKCGPYMDVAIGDCLQGFSLNDEYIEDYEGVVLSVSIQYLIMTTRTTILYQDYGYRL